MAKTAEWGRLTADEMTHPLVLAGSVQINAHARAGFFKYQSLLIPNVERRKTSTILMNRVPSSDETARNTYGPKKRLGINMFFEMRTRLDHAVAQRRD